MLSILGACCCSLGSIVDGTNSFVANVQFFLALEYRLNVSLLGVTLVRNFTFLYFSVHWSACVFYFIARQHGLGADTWIGHDMDLLRRSSPFERWAKFGRSPGTVSV